jgi:hypothetical protein
MPELFRHFCLEKTAGHMYSRLLQKHPAVEGTKFLSDHLDRIPFP